MGRRRAAAIIGATCCLVGSMVGCDTTSPAPNPATTPVTAAPAALITAPATTQAPSAASPSETWPDTTNRGTVTAMIGGDGPDGDDAGVRYPAEEALDLGPLPAAITEQQGRNDPAAVAAQWAALKILTSGAYDGPLWPYSVAGHLAALSDPDGQYLPDGRISDLHIGAVTRPDSTTALVPVTVTATNDLDTLTVAYTIELWLSDDDHWLVAFADPTEASRP